MRFLLCSLALLAVGFGCGGTSSLPDLVKVSGTIQLDGEPLESATVCFSPVDPKVGQPVTGIVKNGHFELATSASSPGVVIGKYQVSLTAFDDLAAPLDPSQPLPPADDLIPKMYSNPKTSGLEVDVKPGLAPLEWNLEK